MFALFTIASIAPACFCAFIAGNSFSTMIPGVPRISSTMAGVTVSIVLAVTGVATHLIDFFTIVGASFGPICGAMAADYLLSGKRWAGPREGVNWAGYLAWALGFVVGILPFLPVSATLKTYVQPAVLYSFVTGFVVYAVLAKAGLQPRTVAMAAAQSLTGVTAKSEDKGKIRRNYCRGPGLMNQSPGGNAHPSNLLESKSRYPHSA
jgi:cytosine permease